MTAIMESPPLVETWAERHGRHLRRQRLAANDEMQLRPGPRDLAGDIAHGDGPVHGRAEAAGGDGADLLSARRRDRGALAGRRPALGAKTDPHPGRAFRDLAL